MKKLPFIRRILSDNQYDWLLNHLPFRLMYVKRMIDSQHSMWFPRWGVSDKQRKEAEEWAEKMSKKFKDL